MWEEADIVQHAAAWDLLEQPKHLGGASGSQAYRSWPVSPYLSFVQNIMHRCREQKSINEW